MRNNILFILFLAGLSALAGYLMSSMSWIGRVGINLVHQEYKFLKVWWQGGATVFAVLLLLFAIQYALFKSLPIVLSRLLQVVFLAAAIGGLYFTYQDFSDDFTHHILKSRFHLGAYLFWIGWMLVCLFMLPKKKHISIAAITNADKKAAADR